MTWAKSANRARGTKTWQEALDYVQALRVEKYLGYDDWRLPNVGELESLLMKPPDIIAWLRAQGFSDIQQDSYWTSTSYASYPAYAWSVDTYSGIVAGRGKEDVGYLWPVRGGRGGALAVPRTGQSACYDRSGAVRACAGTGEDGDLRAGAAWPTPRFLDGGDGTMTDLLTGLVWTRDGNDPGPAACRPAAPRTWHEALEHVRCLNAHRFLGRIDWRLPNRNELASLANRGETSSSQWLNAQGFSGVQGTSYWSSTTYPYNVWNAWSVNLHDGAVTSMAKKHAIHVWPVRGPR